MLQLVANRDPNVGDTETRPNLAAVPSYGYGI